MIKVDREKLRVEYDGKDITKDCVVFARNFLPHQGRHLYFFGGPLGERHLGEMAYWGLKRIKERLNLRNEFEALTWYIQEVLKDGVSKGSNGKGSNGKGGK